MTRFLIPFLAVLAALIPLQILMGDVGNFAVEEVNFALPEHAGANFGWDCFEGTVPFDDCGGAGGCAPEDLDNDGVVGSSDLGALLAAWGL